MNAGLRSVGIQPVLPPPAGFASPQREFLKPPSSFPHPPPKFLYPPANLVLPQRDLLAPQTGFASPQPKGECARYFFCHCEPHRGAAIQPGS